MNLSRRGFFRFLGVGVATAYIEPSVFIDAITPLGITFDPEVILVWQRMLEREVRMKDPLFDPSYGFVGGEVNV